MLRALVGGVLCANLWSCASPIPSTPHQKHKFPDNAYVGTPAHRKFKRLGLVRARTDYTSFDPEHVDRGERGERAMCRNYYNRAVQDLVKFSKEKGGDAVIEIRSAVFLLDGKSELHETPECADDGSEGQVLVQGVAIQWTSKPPVGDVPETPSGPTEVYPAVESE